MSSLIYQNCIKKNNLTINDAYNMLAYACQDYLYLYEKVSSTTMQKLEFTIHNTLSTIVTNMHLIRVVSKIDKCDPHRINFEFFKCDRQVELCETPNGLVFEEIDKYHEKTKIAVGCGTRFYGEDWYHLDIISHPNVDLIGYAHNIPLPDESVDLVYASHVLEYYDWDEAKNIVLPEWKRILKPGGKLRIAVPDFYTLTTWYLNIHEDERNSHELKDIIGPLFGKIGCEVGNIYHKSTYDLNTLCKMLERCEFKEIGQWHWPGTEHAHVDDHSQAYLPKIPLDNPDKKILDLEHGYLISLNVECIK